MVFFDFLFYSIYRLYSTYNEKGAASSSAGIVGGFLALNVLTGIMLYPLFFRKKVHIDSVTVGVLFLIFQVWTFYRYRYQNDRSPEAMERKWSGKPLSYQRRVTVALFLYATAGMISCFGMALYIGSRHETSASGRNITSAANTLFLKGRRVNRSETQSL